MFLNMADGRGVDSQLEQALAGGKPHPTGWFRLFFDDERWEWSPEVERLHSYEPGAAHPTTTGPRRIRLLIAMLSHRAVPERNYRRRASLQPHAIRVPVYS